MWVIINNLKFIIVDELMGVLDLDIFKIIMDIFILLNWDNYIIIILVIYDCKVVEKVDWIIYILDGCI